MGVESRGRQSDQARARVVPQGRPGLPGCRSETVTGPGDQTGISVTMVSRSLYPSQLPTATVVVLLCLKAS